jgi:hypothetical protein
MWIYKCKEGTYSSHTLLGLLWERFTHKFWHLRQGHGWVD